MTKFLEYSIHSSDSLHKVLLKLLSSIYFIELYSEILWLQKQILYLLERWVSLSNEYLSVLPFSSKNLKTIGLSLQALPMHSKKYA